jgi:GNAT superfamily N-acetyltransferase
MIIREANIGDVSQIIECVEEAFTDYIPLIQKKPAPMLADYYEKVKNDSVFVAADGDHIAGVSVIVDSHDDFMWLDILAVFKKYKGIGIGKRLIEYSESFIAQKKKECRIYTNVMFENVIALYEHLGYTEYKRAFEDGYDRVFLNKRLL